jgi:hypothetical protein
MARTGQAAAELIIILGISLVVVVLFFVLSASMLTGAKNQQNYDDARASVQSLAEAADSVYAQGEGATRKVVIILPGDTAFGANHTYIGRPPSAPLASQNGININLNGTDIFAQTRTALSGQFPASSGTYLMRVTSRGAYVDIYPYLVDVDRHSVTIVMARNETRSAQVTVTRVSWEEVSVTPSQNWGFDDVSLSLAPAAGDAFGASAIGSAITVTVTSSPTASGIYNSQLTLDAVGASSGTTEAISIPISVNVRT